jgi:RNA polymerase-associated protein CTR9
MSSQSNGVNGAATAIWQRFGQIPASIDIPVQDGGGEESVELDLAELHDDPTDLCSLLAAENAKKHYWITIASAYAKNGETDYAIEILTKGLADVDAPKPTGAPDARQKADDKLSFLCALCWMYLYKCRDAPRLNPSRSPLLWNALTVRQ